MRLRFVSILGLLIFSSCHHYAVIAAESGIMLREVPYSFRLVGGDAKNQYYNGGTVEGDVTIVMHGKKWIVHINGNTWGAILVDARTMTTGVAR